MIEVVRARCPSCKNVLRIPAAWLSQPMKCKRCRQVFQARMPESVLAVAAAARPVPAPVAVPAPLAVPAPVAVPAPMAAVSPSPPRAVVALVGDPFSFDEDSDGPIVEVGPPRRNRWVGWVVGIFVIGIAAAALAIAGPHIAEWLQTSEFVDDGDKVVQAGDKEGEPGSTDKKEAPERDKQTANTDKDSSPSKDKSLTPAHDLFPRRALLINVSNYLLFNPLHYGSKRDPKYPGSSTAVLADLLSRPPMNMPATQVTELADGAAKPMSTTKAAIEQAISEFAETSRAQDRILILFTGHALEIEKTPYLVPVEGNRDKPESLIPLTWVYEQLGKSRARQKVLVLDVFRFPPARGEELPGTGEMTEDFDSAGANPPAGVQVLTSCVKGQQSIEFENGSLFLQALCNSLQERGAGITEPSAPLPLDDVLTKVNQRLKEVLAARKLEQTARLSGQESAGGAAFDPAEPLPPRLVLKPPSSAAQAFVKNVLDEINIIPPPRGSRQAIHLASLPAFALEGFGDYKADYKSLKELEAMAKDKEKYPLRAAYFEVQKILKDSEKVKIKEFFPSPGGPASPQLKKAIAREQEPVGLMQFELKQALDQLILAGEKREQETSKRWQVNFDLAVARLKARLIYLNEYNEILAKVRGDAMPDLSPGDTGFRVGSSVKLATKESEYKRMEKEVKKALAAIVRDHPNTPWAIIAQRDSMTSLGLMWRPGRE